MRIKVPLLTFKEGFPARCLQRLSEYLSKPVALRCCNNVWEIKRMGLSSLNCWYLGFILGGCKERNSQ